MVVNCWLKISVVLNEALQGFREGRGMGTATLEANMAQQLAGLAHEPIFQVLLDVWKAYDLLDRERCLEPPTGYRLGTNLAQILENYWRRQMIAPKVGKYLGTAFGTGRGVTQGDPVSPIIFNIMVDAVVRAALEEVCSPQEARHCMGWEAGERNIVLNADEGSTAGRVQEWVQDDLTVTVAMFQQMGL